MMDRQSYRIQAQRAWFTAAALSALALAASMGSIVVGWYPIRELTTRLAQACLRSWAMLPEMLRLLLAGSVALGIASTSLWIWSVLRQWWSTGAALRTLEKESQGLPPSLAHLLARNGLCARVVITPSPRPVAFTAGLMSPRIVISAGLLDTLAANELEAVLLHEYSHLSHKDPVYVAVGRALSAAFFYLPIVCGLIRRHQVAVELAADQDVIAQQGGELSLASAMTKILRPSPVQTGASCFSGATDLRLSYLLKQEARLPAISYRALAGSAVMIALVLAPIPIAHTLAGALTSASFILQCPL
jgi:hypothetical protein